jgi:uncharacterized membrane protein
MNKVLNWVLVGTGILFLVMLIVWLVPGGWGYGGMMGGYGMMGGRYGFMSPLGWMGMAFMWLVPAAILVLLVAGAVALFNNLTRPSNPTGQTGAPPTNRACQACGKPVQADWAVCPYCGQNL